MAEFPAILEKVSSASGERLCGTYERGLGDDVAAVWFHSHPRRFRLAEDILFHAAGEGFARGKGNRKDTVKTLHPGHGV